MSNTAMDTGISYAGEALAEAKWSPRKSLLFIVGSSLVLWSLIILAAVQLT